MTNEVGKVSGKLTTEQLKKQQEVKQAKELKPEELQVGQELTGVQQTTSDVSMTSQQQKEAKEMEILENLAQLPEEKDEKKETNEFLGKLYETASKDFEAQLKYDGWTGDVADAFSKIWNNEIYGNKHGNTANLVRKDLEAFKKNIESLNEASKKGEQEYAKVFKKIFGIDFNPAKIEEFSKVNQKYTAVTQAKNLEEAVSKKLSLLLKSDKLSEEYMVMNAGVTGNTVTYTSATKNEVYKREYKNLTDILGKENKEIIDKKLEGAKTPEDKYKILHSVAKAVEQSLHKDTELKSGGKEYKALQEEYDNAYKGAFGEKNNIAKRVSDYNISQQRGSQSVKAVTIMAALAIEAGTLGTGTPFATGLMAAGATAAGTTFLTDVSDRFTSGTALDSLKKGGVKEWIEKGAEITDWKQTATASAVSGVMTVAFMGQSYAVTGLCQKAGMSATQSVIANSAAFIGTGLGVEKLMTGEISVEGATFTVLLAVVGGAIQVVKIHKAAAQNTAKLGTDIQNARKTLGFDNETAITPEQLEKQWKSMARHAHPDAGGSDVQMALINSAHDVLKNNIAMINKFNGQNLFTESLKSVKHHGKRVFSDADIKTFKRNTNGLGGEIKNFKAKTMAVLSNPEELANIAVWNNKAAGLWRAIQDPLESTRIANPEVFEGKNVVPNTKPATAEGVGVKYIPETQAQQKETAVPTKAQNFAQQHAYLLKKTPVLGKEALSALRGKKAQPKITIMSKDNGVTTYSDGTKITETTKDGITTTTIKTADGTVATCETIIGSDGLQKVLSGSGDFVKTMLKYADAKPVPQAQPEITILSNKNGVTTYSDGTTITEKTTDGVTEIKIKTADGKIATQQTITDNDGLTVIGGKGNFIELFSKYAEAKPASVSPVKQKTVTDILKEGDTITRYKDGAIMVIKSNNGHEITTIITPEHKILTCDTVTDNDGLTKRLSGDKDFDDALMKYHSEKPVSRAGVVDGIKKEVLYDTNTHKITDVVEYDLKGTEIKRTCYDKDGNMYFQSERTQDGGICKYIEKGKVVKTETFNDSTKQTDVKIYQPDGTTVETKNVQMGPDALIVTRPNGTKINLLENIPTKVLDSKTTNHLHLPAATTVDENFGVTITQAKASPVEAKRIVFADTVAETLRINNENGIPLKYEANPPQGEEPYFYKDAPYGGRQKVNTQSLEVTYTHEATADWGLTPEYVAEYADSNGMCPDRAVVAAGDDPVTGLKGNIAEKQYEIVNPDGTRSPLKVGDLKPGQMVQIIKKQGVELKMAIFDKPTISLEGETLPAGKLMMIDSEGHPYNGNPVKRLRSGEVEMHFSKDVPQQAKMGENLAKIKELDAQTKAAKKAGNKELAGQLKSQADALAKEFEKDLTAFVKDYQEPVDATFVDKTATEQKNPTEFLEKMAKGEVPEKTIVSESNGVTTYSDGTTIRETSTGEGYKTITIKKADGTVASLETFTESDGTTKVLGGKGNFMNMLAEYSNAKPATATIPEKQTPATDMKAIKTMISEARNDNGGYMFPLKEDVTNIMKAIKNFKTDLDKQELLDKLINFRPFINQTNVQPGDCSAQNVIDYFKIMSGQPAKVQKQFASWMSGNTSEYLDKVFGLLKSGKITPKDLTYITENITGNDVDTIYNSILDMFCKNSDLVKNKEIIIKKLNENTTLQQWQCELSDFALETDTETFVKLISFVTKENAEDFIKGFVDARSHRPDSYKKLMTIINQDNATDIYKLTVEKGLHYTIQEYLKKKTLAPALKQLLTDALKQSYYDEETIITLMDENPSLVPTLFNVKNQAGKRMFTPKEIIDIFDQCEDIIKEDSSVITKYLKNPELLSILETSEDKAFDIWKYLQE